MNGGAHWVAAGSSQGGQRVFVAAKIDEFDLGAEGDKHTAYLIISDWKNSRGKCRAQILIERQICSNGMTAFISEAAMSWKHTKNVNKRMQSVAKSIDLVTETLATLKAKMTTLQTRKVSREQVTRILDRLYPPTEAEVTENKVNKQRAERQAFVLELLENNDNNAFPSEAGTAFAMLQSVTNSVDHSQVARATGAMTVEQKRADNALFEKGAEFKQSALEIILEETGGYSMQGRAILDDILDASTLQ
jgi:hypothetical protein